MWNFVTTSIHPDKVWRVWQQFWQTVVDGVQPMYDAVGFYFG